MTHDRTRWHALYVLCGGMLMIVLDATIVNVALPAIQDDLGFSASGLAWVVNGYLITFGGLLLLAGRLGDLLGRRTIFLAGLAVFTTASLLCGLATSQGLLVAARFVQGAGGAMTSAVILGMIFSMFPEPNELAKAIGVFGFVASGGGSVGLLAGGVVTQALDWHWIFLVNLPIGILTALLAVRLVQPDSGLGLMGVGGGLSFPPIMTLAMSSATPADAGLVSGLDTTSAQVGGAYGLAVLATVSAAHAETLTSHGAAHAQALTDGYHLAFWIGVGMLAAAMAVTLAILRPTPTAAPDVEPQVNPCTPPEHEKPVTATLTS
jgi:MFS family permease